MTGCCFALVQPGPNEKIGLHPCSQHDFPLPGSGNFATVGLTMEGDTASTGARRQKFGLSMRAEHRISSNQKFHLWACEKFHKVQLRVGDR